MFRRSVVAWIVNLCPLLRRSQAKTLAAISWGAMKCRRVSQADIGRAMETDTVTKHNIKRVSRFVRNNRVNLAEGCRGLIALAAKAAGRCLAVAVDWVDIGQYKVLKAAVPIRGRAAPILLAVYPKWRLKKSQNAFEEAFFELLATLLPARTWSGRPDGWSVCSWCWHTRISCSCSSGSCAGTLCQKRIGRQRPPKRAIRHVASR